MKPTFGTSGPYLLNYLKNFKTKYWLGPCLLALLVKKTNLFWNQTPEGSFTLKSDYNYLLKKNPNNTDLTWFWKAHNHPREKNFLWKCFLYAFPVPPKYSPLASLPNLLHCWRNINSHPSRLPWIQKILDELYLPSKFLSSKLNHLAATKRNRPFPIHV